MIYSTVFVWSNSLFTKFTGEDIIEYLYKLKPEHPSAHMYKFTNFQAKIGLEQMKKLDKYSKTINKFYANIWKKFKKEHKTLAHVKNPPKRKLRIPKK